MSGQHDVPRLADSALLLREAPYLTESRAIRAPHSIALPGKLDLAQGFEVLASFARSRSVPIDWSEIISVEDVLAESDELTRFRADFEASWDGSPLYYTKSQAQFIELAPANIAERVLGIEPGELLLYLPGQPRANTAAEVITDQVAQALPFSLKVVTYTLTRRYLGPDPLITWRYYKLIPKQQSGQPVAVDFWKDAASYAAAWENIEQVTEVKPIAVPTAVKETRRGNKVVRRTGSGFPALAFEDEEARKGIPDLSLATARSQFEVQIRGNVQADRTLRPETSFPITKASTQEQFFAAVTDETGTIAKKPIADGTILLRMGRGQQVFRVVPHAHIAGTLETLFRKLSGQLGPASYESAWKTDIASVERVYRDKEYERSHTHARYLDLMAQYIRRHFWDIDARIELYAQLASLAKGVPAGLDAARASPAEIDEAIERYRDLHARKIANEFEMRKLVDAARALNYQLNTKNKGEAGALQVTIPKKGGGTEVRDLLKGELYRPVMRSVSWYEPGPVSLAEATLKLSDLVRLFSPLPFPFNVSRNLRRTVLNPSGSSLRALGGGLLGGLGGLGRAIGLGPLSPGGLLPRVLGLPFPNPFSLLRGSQTPKAYLQQVVKEYVDYEIENSTQSPVDELVAKLRAEGLSVFVFSLTNAGYTDTEGRQLADVMRWCRLDEAFRISCVVLIPRYQRTLLDGPLEIGYHVIRGPRAGSAIVEPPKLGIEDRLSFVTQWLGTELGVPIDSLNLAPGESRTVTLTRDYAAASRTASEVTEEFDVTESYSTSFTTEFERTVRREQENRTASNWNAKASASFGPFSAGGGGGGESEKTVKDFAQDVQKSAQKAASEVTRKTQRKITTTKTDETSIKTTDSTASQISNVNAGATLNLTFYQLNNVFASAVRADGIRLVVSSGVELIEGTGIVEQRRFEVGELEAALAVLVSAPAFAGHLAGVRVDVVSAALEALTKVLHDDYYRGAGLIDLGKDANLEKTLNFAVTPEGSAVERYASAWRRAAEANRPTPGSDVRVAGAARGPAVAAIGMAGPPVTVADMPADAAAAAAEGAWGGDGADGAVGSAATDALLAFTLQNGAASPSRVTEVDAIAWQTVLEDQLATVRKTFAAWSETPKAIAQSLLSLPSAAVHMDSRLGEGRATEPYADFMRHAEWEGKRAQVEVARAGAELQRAQAAALANGGKLHVKGTHRLSEPKIRDVKTDSITLTGPLPPGQWALSGDLEVIFLGPAHEGRDTITLKNVDIEKNVSVNLVEITSGIYIAA